MMNLYLLFTHSLCLKFFFFLSWTRKNFSLAVHTIVSVQTSLSTVTLNVVHIRLVWIPISVSLTVFLTFVFVFNLSRRETNAKFSFDVIDHLSLIFSSDSHSVHLSAALLAPFAFQVNWFSTLINRIAFFIRFLFMILSSLCFYIPLLIPTSDLFFCANQFKVLSVVLIFISLSKWPPWICWSISCLVWPFTSLSYSQGLLGLVFFHIRVVDSHWEFPNHIFFTRTHIHIHLLWFMCLLRRDSPFFSSLPHLVCHRLPLESLFTPFFIFLISLLAVSHLELNVSFPLLLSLCWTRFDLLFSQLFSFSLSFVFKSRLPFSPPSLARADWNFFGVSTLPLLHLLVKQIMSHLTNWSDRF